MRGKSKFKKREIEPDLKYDSVLVARLVNYCMKGGKKNLARKHVYRAIEDSAKKLKKEPVQALETAIENISPRMEVRSRRIGGANYQVPMEVRPARKLQLAMRWMVEAARAKKGEIFAKKLSDEIILANKQEGEAMRKRELMHKAAAANKAFAHFARY